MKLKIENDDLLLQENSTIRAESIDVYEIDFEFTPDWDELDKKIIFVNGSDVYEQVIFDNKSKIPSLPNGNYSIGIVGFFVENDIIVKRKATNMLYQIVTVSAAEFKKTQEQEEQEATVYEKYLTDLKNSAEEIKKDFDSYAQEKITEIKNSTDVYTKNEMDNKLKNYLEFEVVEEI